MRRDDFKDDSLPFGQLGESEIANWMRLNGNTILPAYEKEIDTGKGPRLFIPAGKLVVPDAFVFPALEWAEFKHKTVFTWHHKSGRWTTGIDLNHYRDYQEVQRVTGRRVWLLFLHRSAVPDRIDLAGRDDCLRCRASPNGTCCPPECPTGLFAASLKYLTAHVNHRHKNHGRHGMVYWAHETLRLLAPLEEIRREAA